jgi:nickel/cobalt exporter
MTEEIQILTATAATIAFVHTLMGPDHYLPFVAMAKARRWDIRKVISITLLCGVGHIVGSIALGLIGVALGTTIASLEWFESVRGDVAAWGLIAFGLTYLAWGLQRAYKNRTHVHIHSHGDSAHSHSHGHSHSHAHLHQAEGGAGKSLTPWIIFVIFVLGPCEPLIPLLMYPAAKESMTGLVLVTATFGVVTMLTMLGAVLVSTWGLKAVKLPKLERFGHAMAGGTILMCGLSISFLGL